MGLFLFADAYIAALQETESSYTLLLPSATKLRRLYFHRRLSVHKGEVSAPWGCAWSEGVGIPACTEADPSPGETATAADGTHPTGMHSCTFVVNVL